MEATRRDRFEPAAACDGDWCARAGKPARILVVRLAQLTNFVVPPAIQHGRFRYRAGVEGASADACKAEVLTDGDGHEARFCGTVAELAELIHAPAVCPSLRSQRAGMHLSSCDL